MQEVVGSDP